MGKSLKEKQGFIVERIEGMRDRSGRFFFTPWTYRFAIQTLDNQSWGSII